jgi:hypothetical protein
MKLLYLCIVKRIWWLLETINWWCSACFFSRGYQALYIPSAVDHLWVIWLLIQAQYSVTKPILHFPSSLHYLQATSGGSLQAITPHLMSSWWSPSLFIVRVYYWSSWKFNLVPSFVELAAIFLYHIITDCRTGADYGPLIQSIKLGELSYYPAPWFNRTSFHR